MLERLKNEVLEANLELMRRGLVVYTWGNVSGIDRESGLVVIKPSGVEYGRLGMGDMVVVDLKGRVVEGKLRPSSDTPTHLELYRKHPEIGGVVHTHSTFATAFAQAGKAIPPYGTTHADYFYGEIPCTGDLTEEQVAEAYELNTGVKINEVFEGRDVSATPACLVKNHGVFAWGKDAVEAVYHAVVCEKVAEMAYYTLALDPLAGTAPRYVQDKHYSRKHGPDAYYGQEKK